MSRSQNDHKEIRAVTAAVSSVEFRQSKSGGKILHGTIPYNSRSLWLGFYEQLQSRCFAQSIRDGGQVANWSHNMDLILGSTKGNTLRITDNDSALLYEIILPDTVDGERARVLAERGDISTSFEFYLTDETDDDWKLLPDGSPLRTIRRAVLTAVSPCAVPAYPEASLKLRDAAIRNAPSTIRDVLKRDDNTDTNPDDKDTDTDCECDCSQCVSGTCDDCISPDADEETCACHAATGTQHVVALLRRRALLLD